MRSLRFLTWLDIRRLIRTKTAYGRNLPEGVNSINCYSDALEISYISDNSRTLIESKLQEWFGGWYQKEDSLIQLDLGDSVLPVEFLKEGANQDAPTVIRPFWEEVAYIGGDSNKPKDLPDNLLPKPFQGSPSLVSFYSFKGGVGRTTHLAAYLFALLECAREIGKPITVLVIDADLEAPGLTYWNRVEKLQPAVSFLDFLEAYHYSPLPKKDTLNQFAEEVKKSKSPKHEGESISYFLPACLSDEQLLDTPILPENLTRSLGNVWTFSDAIHDLGKTLKADYVIVDLRAGLSEISSPLIFDPRVQRFFVTTPSSQSVNGLELVLKQVSRIVPSQEDINNSKYFDPSVIISFLTREMKNSYEIDEILIKFRTAYNQDKDSFIDDSSTRLEIKETEFSQQMLYVNSWEDARLKLSTTYEIARFAKEWAVSQLRDFVKLNDSSISNIEANSISDVKELPNRLEQVRTFRDICQLYEFAEEGTGQDLLITETLKNLATNFRVDLPRVVSIGEKGSGKTFMYVQLARLEYWEKFLEIALKEKVESQTYIFPFLQSKNLKDNAQNIVDKARNNVRSALSVNIEFNRSAYQDRILKALDKNLSELEWTHFWITEIARCLGMPIEEISISIQEINNYLKEKKVRVVLLFDGLEDIFQNASSNQNQKIALKTLTDIPDRLSETRQANLGLIVLLRRDFLRYAIDQNVGQFESRYRSYALSWDVDSFLKLVYWICTQGKLIIGAENNVDILGREALVKELEQLWGEKLGDSKSEARTASWVFAALSDFKGRLQARDIVRLLFHAADKTVDSSKEMKFDKWSGSRFLPPQAIRDALTPCSEKKVSEAKEEYPDFKAWVEKIKGYTKEQKKIPFQPQEFNLEASTITMLEEIGVIFEDRDKDDVARYYIPEIFRTGLDFNLPSGARPRVLALKRKALGIGTL